MFWCPYLRHVLIRNEQHVFRPNKHNKKYEAAFFNALVSPFWLCATNLLSKIDLIDTLHNCNNTSCFRKIWKIINIPFMRNQQLPLPCCVFVQSLIHPICVSIRLRFAPSRRIPFAQHGPNWREGPKKGKFNRFLIYS